MFNNVKKRAKALAALAFGVAAVGIFAAAPIAGAATQDVLLAHDFNTYDSSISFEKAGWATMAGSGFMFNDGYRGIWGPNIDQDNAQAFPYDTMRYRLYLNKQITPNNNAIAIGYNELYDTVKDFEKPEGDKKLENPYVVYDNTNPGNALAFKDGDNVIIQARVKSDLKRFSIAANLKDNYGKDAFFTLLESYEYGTYVRTGYHNWNRGNWICNLNQGQDYLITIVMKAGTNKLQVLIDGALLTEWGIYNETADPNQVLQTINKVYIYSGFLSEEQPVDPTKLFYIDDFKIAKGDYIIGDIRYNSPAIEHSNTPCVSGKLTASWDMTVLDQGVEMPLALLAAEYDAAGKLVGVAATEKVFKSEDALHPDPVGGGARHGNGTLLDKMKLTCDLNMAGGGSNIVKIFAWNTIAAMAPVKKTEILQNTTNVYIASDSLAAAYRAVDYPQAGWGMFLPGLLADNAIVHNEAIGGASTKTYYNTYWSGKIRDVLQPGDYVLLAFAHNDRWGINLDTCVNIEDYKMYLNKFIGEAREKGAEPILITAFNRGEDKDTSIVIEDGVTYDYAAAMKEVAAEQGVVCLDLHQRILDYMAADKAANGSIEKTKEELYLYHLAEQGILTEDEVKNHQNNSLRQWGEDLTHTSETGAAKVAGWIVELLKASASGLKDYVK